MVALPAMLNAPVALFTPALANDTLLKLLAPMLCEALLLLKLMVEPVSVNVPLLVQLPATLCVNAPPVKVVPVP
ncbi:MAG: hypothetical protein WCG93_11200, partial [Paludibacter sp.]